MDHLPQPSANRSLQPSMIHQSRVPQRPAPRMIRAIAEVASVPIDQRQRPVVGADWMGDAAGE